MLLLDWNTANDGLGGSGLWHTYEHTITPAILAAAGLVPSDDMRLVFRQRDNFAFGTDGLAIDDVEILPLNPIPDVGQLSVPGQSLLDVGYARNANCSGVDDAGDPSGPFFASLTGGAPLRLVVEGEPAQPFLLLASPTLAPALLVFPTPTPGAAQLDVGVPSATPPFFTDVGLVADGTGPGFFDQFFNTGPSGRFELVSAAPPAFAGLTMAFQAVVFHSTDIVRTTNAVAVTIE